MNGIIEAIVSGCGWGLAIAFALAWKRERNARARSEDRNVYVHQDGAWRLANFVERRWRGSNPPPPPSSPRPILGVYRGSHE